MHEDRKLKEAWFFLTEMHGRVHDPSAFIHLLSAFLSAARSVAQYAHKEAPGWYAGEVGNYCLIKYFKDERDVNIHTKPVDPKTITKVTGSIQMFMSGSADYGVTFIDENGTPVEFKQVGGPPISPPQPAQPVPEMRYEFADRPNESILTLCETYLKELEKLVADGHGQGHLTP
jgi:hypothetical protein